MLNFAKSVSICYLSAGWCCNIDMFQLKGKRSEDGPYLGPVWVTSSPGQSHINNNWKLFFSSWPPSGCDSLPSLASLILRANCMCAAQFIALPPPQDNVWRLSLVLETAGRAQSQGIWHATAVQPNDIYQTIAGTQSEQLNISHN